MTAMLTLGRWHISTAAGLLAGVLLAGCQLEPPSAYPQSGSDRTGAPAATVAVGDNPTQVDASFDALFRSAARTLRDHRFTIARQDERQGEILTEPMTGQQAWEFWRSDAVGLYNQLESSLHTILRTVEVRVSPARDAQGRQVADKQMLEVRVFTDRLSVPERAFTASNQLPRTYVSGKGLVDAMELEHEHAGRERPVFLGRIACWKTG